MIPFLLSLLVLLLYAAIAMVIIYIIIFFVQKIFPGLVLDARIVQLLYVIVALIFVIWLVQSLVTHTPIPTPWGAR